MFIQLDDDRNDDSYIHIRDNKMNDRFKVGEIRQSYLKGDRTVTGDINLVESINGEEWIEIIFGRSFEGALSSEKSSYIGSVTLPESSPEVSAALTCLMVRPSQKRR